MMETEQDNPTQWRKGMPSPNPKGRTPIPKTVKEVRALAKVHTASMIQVLVRVAENSKSPPAARVAAASAIIDRGWGKPGSDVETGTSGLTIKIITFNENLAEEMKVINGTIENDDSETN